MDKFRPSIFKEHTTYATLAVFIFGGGFWMALDRILPSTPNNGWCILALTFGTTLLLSLIADIIYRWQNSYLILRGRKMYIAIGFVIILAGLGLVVSQLDYKVEQQEPNDDLSKTLSEQTSVKEPSTIVKCCINTNIYQVWASNNGSDKDTLFVTLGTDGLINNIRATMGASLPTILEGGTNANFVTFKIDELLPNMSINYIVTINNNIVKQPHKFSAWSSITKNDVETEFIGECPKIGNWGPEETFKQQ